MIYDGIDNKDEMWYKLGLHFCKLKEYCRIIQEIFNSQFGKSHKLSKKINILNNKFKYLNNNLIEILQKQYPVQINNLEYMGTHSILDIFNRLYIYNDNNTINYNEKIDDTGNNKILNLRLCPGIGERYNKKLTYSEKEFIDIFTQNLIEYLNNIAYLESYDSLYINKIQKYTISIKNYVLKLNPEINQIQILE